MKFVLTKVICLRFSGRGLYNYLCRHEAHQANCDDFRLRDYRAMNLEDIYSELEDIGICLPEGGFKVASEDFDTPEEMLESLDDTLLTGDQKERAFLCFFELWRRINSDRPSISIFFDDLDRVIDQYLKDPQNYEEILSVALIDLQLILESLTERVKRDEAIFRTLMHYSSHDLEAVIYNFIFDLLQQKEFSKSSEFIDGFYSFVKDKRWFDFLRIKSFDNPLGHEVQKYIETLLLSLEEKKDFYLTLALLNYFNESNLLDYFLDLFVKVLPQAKTQEEHKELLDLLFTFFTLNDDEEKSQEVLAHIEKKEFKKKGDSLKILGGIIKNSF